MAPENDSTRDEIERRLLAGETLSAVADDLGLDVVTAEDGEEMIALPGYVADDGNADVYYEHAVGASEAAHEYVDDGDWGESDQTTWIDVYVWRVGLRLAGTECAYCSSLATAHDDDGDPACEEHAGTPEDGVELEPIGHDVGEATTDRECFKISVDPDEPECDDSTEHDWCSPHEIVGGIEENPGVWCHGGGIVAHEVCMRCGCGRTTDTWAQDMSDGTQGLTSVSYEPRKYAEAICEARAIQD